MPLKIKEYMPDYLKDFEDVNVLCEALEAPCLHFYLKISEVLNKIRLNSTSTKRWNKMVFCEKDLRHDGDRIAIIHKLIQKPTLEDYSFYITHWIDTDVTQTLTFDKETNTFNLKLVGDNKYTKEKGKLLRNLFPMNSKLVIEVEE